ncbi:MAG: Rieske 2Fe-2S domain-containing protein [Pirellulaceae bacterium]
MKFVENAWYAIGLSTVIETGKMLERTVCDQNLVFYRRPDGSPVALRNRCPHRFAPLSKGRLEGCVVTCVYHGLKFDDTGKCVHNPHGDGSIPKAAVVRNYPVVDRHGFSWVWMGDTRKADEKLIPDLSPLDSAPATATFRGTFISPLNYVLQMDNLMDFSHVDHLHTWFETGGLSTAKPSVTERDNSVSSLWKWEADHGFGLHKDHMAPGPVDSYMESLWFAPSIIVNKLSSVARGRPRDEGTGIFAVHLLTPETDRSILYSYALTRNFALADAELTSQTEKALLFVNETEDMPMVGAVLKEMGDQDFWSLNPVLLQHDAGPIRVRRTLDRLLKEQTSA